MRRELTGLLAAALLLAAAPTGAAETTAGGQEPPLVVESDEMVIRDAEQKAIYSGDVKATKGGMVLRAERLVVEYTDAGLQRAHAYGRPVTMDQGKRHGEAREAVYEAAERAVVLMGDARLVEGPNTLEGGRIRYYLDERRTEVFSNGDDGEEGRARAVFQPGSKPGEDAPGEKPAANE
jgi:lipopolysaccharide export system protein LptA